MTPLAKPDDAADQGAAGRFQRRFAAGFARLRNLFFTRVHREQLIRGLDWAAEEMLGSFENGAGHSCSIVELVI